MSKMMLYLTTRGRPDDQLTLSCLPKKWLQRTVVVCPRAERSGFEIHWPDLYGIWTPDVKNLPEKRAAVFKTTKIDKIMMLDDDLRFHVRQGPKLVRAATDDPRLDRMFTRIEDMLNVYAHGGITDRFMGHVHKNEFRYNARCLHALAYHVPTVLKHCELNRIELSSDYDYTLQLLRAGYENFVYCRGAQEDPKGFNAPGGVSLYRTPAKVLKSSRLLEKFHPGIVRLAPYKDGSKYGEFGVRTVANWKKAIKEGLDKRDVTYGTLTGWHP